MYVLEIYDWICIYSSKVAVYSRTFAAYDVAEDFVCKLFALIVSYDGYLQLLLMSEILMIVHFSGNKGIGPLPDGLRQQKVACTAAHGHGVYRSAQQLVGGHAVNVESALKCTDEVGCRQGLRQLPNDTLACADTINILLSAKEADGGESHFLCNLVVHASLGTIHVGVHGHYADMVLNGFHYRALHIVFTGYAAEFPKDERVVRHNEVAAEADGLVHHIFGDVKTQ